MGKKVLVFQMSKPSAIALIRRLAQDSKVGWTEHVKRQMKKRRISSTQVLRCLEKGVITEGPAMDIKGNWTCRLQLFTAGETISVVTAITHEEDKEYLEIITVYGE